MHPDTFTNYLAHLYPPRRQRYIQTCELKEFVPVVEDDVARVLGLLIRLVSAERVLEIGTSIGFSTIQLAEAMEQRGGRVVTVEFDPLVAEQALKNFERCGMQDRIQLLAGDAMDIVPRLPGAFDAIFLDVDKHLYAPLLEDCIRLLRPGGLLMAEVTLVPRKTRFRLLAGLGRADFPGNPLRVRTAKTAPPAAPGRPPAATGRC